jgi:hypothetical protein
VSDRKGLLTAREEVWLRVFVAVASCHNSARSTSLEWADKTLADFDKRFPEAKRIESEAA